MRSQVAGLVFLFASPSSSELTVWQKTRMRLQAALAAQATVPAILLRSDC